MNNFVYETPTGRTLIGYMPLGYDEMLDIFNLAYEK